MDNEVILEKQFAKDRQRFWEKRYYDKYNRPPTKAELLRLGAITMAFTGGLLGVAVGVPVIIGTQLAEPAATLGWMVASVAAPFEGVAAMKYGPNLVFKTDAFLARMQNRLTRLAI